MSSRLWLWDISDGVGGKKLSEGRPPLIVSTLSGADS